MTDEPQDIHALRGRLEGTRGREQLRSLEEVAGTPAFKEFLHREFPQHASEWLDPVGRRGFLKLMGASLALAGLSACTRQPDEVIVPYVRQPEEVVPGRPLFYATAMPLGGAGLGLLVESHEGRPTKIEGNPDHPSSRGATDVFAQAAILGLYDPDRAQTLSHLGEIQPFAAFVAAMRTVLAAQEDKQGSGLRILTDTVASPTLAAQIQELLERFPGATWTQWDPAGRHNAREGSLLAFGVYVDPQYTVDRADVILSLDADFLCSGPDGLRHARAFASRRRIEGDASRLNRLYAVESSPTNTGTKADHRLPLRPSDIEPFARALASRLGVGTEAGRVGVGAGGATAAAAPAAAEAWIGPLVQDLVTHRGRSLVIAGETQPPLVHALAHAMNEALGNVGVTVTYVAPAEARPSNQPRAMRTLAAEMRSGQVDFLLILGGNPAYSAPADLRFTDALQRVPLRAYLGPYEDETAALCHWQLPETHFLEAWSDVRAADGTVTIIQPLIAPLYQGLSAHQAVAALSDQPERTGYEIVRSFWARETGLSRFIPRVPAPVAEPGGPPPVAPAASVNLSAFDRAWRTWLHDGVVPDTAFAPLPVLLNDDIAATAGADRAAEPDTLEAIFLPDPAVYDGRFANNAWLQELPKPLTKLTWDNAALVAPATAARLSVASGDVVELRHGDRTLRIPVWVAPGHAPDCVTLHLGYGHTRGGRISRGTGFDVNVLRTSTSPSILTGVRLTRTDARYPLACTQDHWSLEGRNIVRAGTAGQFARNPRFAQAMEHIPLTGLSMYPERTYEGYAWGMAIDQNVCTGCNACVVACQAENNVPVVGKDEVLNGREMHWLRLDRYYSGSLDNPDTYHQPMLCMQCEQAPCEVVCPVAATVHSDEGLNDMVYNRCVGTRYCSNNCPYKVRRFNFLLYQDWETPSLKMMRNPDVTVRSRGVMEKCTYCVQRINQARADSIREERTIRDGEIVTACQSSCPTDAIVFGDINDPKSRVSRLKAGPLNYSVLGELNTRPRTTYLALVRNPNEAIEPDTDGGTGH